MHLRRDCASVISSIFSTTDLRLQDNSKMLFFFLYPLSAHTYSPLCIVNGLNAQISEFVKLHRTSGISLTLGYIYRFVLHGHVLLPSFTAGRLENLGRRRTGSMVLHLSQYVYEACSIQNVKLAMSLDGI